MNAPIKSLLLRYLEDRDRGRTLTAEQLCPDSPDELPKVNVSKLPLTEVRQHLPATTRVVSAGERNEQIRIRQEHVQRRYRQY